MRTVLREFYDALTAQEERFIAHLAADNLGIILRSAIGELDWYCYNFSKTAEPTSDQEELFYLMQQGVTRLIALALEARASFDAPVVNFRRKKELTKFVTEIISAIGIIQHGRRVAQTVALGIGRIERLRDNEFKIILPDKLVDEGSLETAVSKHYQSESRRMFSKIKDSKHWKELDVKVNAKLHELVHPFATHYIGYGADPLLDDYFFGLAYHEIELQDGFDTFHYATIFGGVRFQHYVLGVAFLMSLQFKHERFAEALVKKDSTILLQDILTITSDTGGLVESIKEAINSFGEVFDDFEKVDLKMAQTIFEVLSCGRRNTAVLSAPGSPLPLIVQSSDDGVIRCLAGAYTEPMRMLLESLRHQFPKDYAKNQQSREGAMQKAIKRALNATFCHLEYRENIKIQSNAKTLTDLDLVVIEKNSGRIILCQLKHQELYGQNLHSKRIRAERLREEVAAWLNALDKWGTTATKHSVKELLGLPAAFPDPTIYRLIITKHYAHPIREICATDDTTFSTWIQFYNGIELLKQRDAPKTLDELFRILREEQSPSRIQDHLPEPCTTWSINELKFATLQEGQHSSAKQ